MRRSRAGRPTSASSAGARSASRLHWPAPDAFPGLPPEKTVHLWGLSTNIRALSQRRLWSLLSPTERERAARYRFGGDRKAFVLRRGVLRLLLGRYLRVLPERVALAYGAHGKPSLHASHGARLRFNLSRTDGLVLYAFALEVPLGVDVEHVQSIENPGRLAAQVFSPREQEDFSRLLPAERFQGFLNGWTRKEAFAKAVGAGLSLPLDAFDVTLAPGQPATLRAVRAPSESNEACSGDWVLRDLHPTSHHTAALAVRAAPKQIRRFAWPPRWGRQ